MIALLLFISADLQVAAASDLAGVRPALTAAFAKETAIKVRFTLGSSGLLAKQIDNGAPFDLFLSANERLVTDLARTGKVDRATVRVYASGVLGLWSFRGKVRRVEDLASLPDVKHIAIANPLHAPYGVAAREVLEKFNLWTPLQPKIVYGENVRQALQFAESGNADAVLTAWPLLLDKPNAVPIPTAWHQPIRQAGGVVSASGQPDIALKFLRFLAEGAGARILRDAGFGKP